MNRDWQRKRMKRNEFDWLNMFWIYIAVPRRRTGEVNNHHRLKMNVNNFLHGYCMLTNLSSNCDCESEMFLANYFIFKSLTLFSRESRLLSERNEVYCKHCFLRLNVSSFIMTTQQVAAKALFLLTIVQITRFLCYLNWSHSHLQQKKHITHFFYIVLWIFCVFRVIRMLGFISI